MKAPPASPAAPQTPRAAPPWGLLGLLAVAVLALHALVLQTAPLRFGLALAPETPHPPAFVTRRIEAPPAPEPAAPPPTVQPVAKPAAKPPAIKKKKAAVQRPPAQETIEFVAPTEPEPVLTAEASAPEPPPEAAVPEPETAAEAPAASAESAPPAGPSQTPVTAIALPASARLDYKMTGSAKGLTYYANAELAWNNAGSAYDARMTVSALFLGARSLASQGQLGPEGLAPSRFSDKSKSEVAAHFEPDKGQISFSANTPTVPWVKGAQDRVSVFLQLGGMLAGQPERFAPGASISLYTVGPRDADTWTFLVEAEEQLALPMGTLRTLKLTRQPRREYDQKVEIWFAPALGYLPVRSKVTQHSGDFIDQQLRAVNPP
ncbi:MAG: DUF3108 domain-containing protein [Polaromonas sp.]|nr:DUF3108 domain-containing protein [Polaromonas sp.]